MKPVINNRFFPVVAAFLLVVAIMRFYTAFAAPGYPAGTGMNIPTYNALNVKSTSGNIFSISSNFAMLSTTGPTNPYVTINDAQGLALTGGGGISAWGQNVKITDPTSAGLKFDAQIPIWNSTVTAGVNNPVMVADSAGLTVASEGATPTPLFNVNGITGNINNPQGPSTAFCTFTPYSPLCKSIMVQDTQGLTVTKDDGTNPVLSIYAGNADANSGTITNPGTTAAVRVDDKDGFEYASEDSSVKFKISGTSDALPFSISNPYILGLPQPVTINDDLDIRGNIQDNAAGKPVNFPDPEGMVVTRPGAAGIGLSVNGSGASFINVWNNGGIHTSANISEQGNVLNPLGTLWISGPADIYSPGAGSIGLINPGRMLTGGDSGGAGGVWLNAALTEFFGDLTYLGTGANKLGFWDNGSWRMSIDSSGQVGMGTGSPAENFDVHGTADTRLRVGSTSTASAGWTGFDLYDPNVGFSRGGLGMMNNDKSNVGIWDNTGETLAIKNGNVGIGTTTPSYKLEVKGPINTVSGVNGTFLAANGAQAGYFNGPGSYFSWGGGGTSNYYADNVGIGKQATGNSLDVGGSINSDSNITAYSGYVRGSSVGYFYVCTGLTTYPRQNTGNPNGNACHNEGWWAGGVTPNSKCALYANCASNDIVVSVMPGDFTTPGAGKDWKFFAAGGYGGTQGYVVYTTDNQALAPATHSARVVCFSPNGPPTAAEQSSLVPSQDSYCNF